MQDFHIFPFIFYLVSYTVASPWDVLEYAIFVISELS
uniref:Uncharacterized protein n=1 Tax=Arundo donax TaxID=35708 RepID=A0A0A9FTM0_ARUDO